MDDRTRIRWGAITLLLLAISILGGVWHDEAPISAQVIYEPGVPVGGKIEAENACYVRLPDLPEPRYGGMGAYNHDTGVLMYAGGAKKLGEGNNNNTQTHSDMWAIKLDGSMDAWRTIRYSPRDGYNIGQDRGCREMANVAAAPHHWVSVLGTDGCAGGTSTAGDVKEISVGSEATRSEIRFLPSSRVRIAPERLLSEGAKLTRHFAVMDTNRGRGVFGQGTFDTDFVQDSQDEVYSGRKIGTEWHVSQLHPAGPIPSRRFGSCAAYIHHEDEGLDGILVMGGNSGGPEPITFEEVWWLDFSNTIQGQWMEITDRFGNMADFGPRQSGACAYDADSRMFYSWFGRASADIPDGDSRSAGAWRADLTQLADPDAELSWERLAKDDQPDVRGRRLIPNLWDPVHKRMLVVGGRNRLDEHRDVWAIYPDVTGADCQSLDPFEALRPPTPTPRPVVTPLPDDAPRSCPQLTGRVPQAVITNALASPASIDGWGQHCSPSQPAGRFNPLRTSLGLRNASLPYHPVYNGVVYKCGCP